MGGNKTSWIGVALTAVGTVLLVMNAIAPAAKERSGVSFAVFLVSALGFEWICLCVAGMAIVVAGNRRFRAFAHRTIRGLVRKDWQSPAEYLRHLVLSVLLIAALAWSVKHIWSKFYYVFRARSYYASQLLYRDYAAAPLRRAYRFQTQRDYRAALREIDSIKVPGYGPEEMEHRNVQIMRSLVKYVENLSERARRDEASAGHITRASIASRIEWLRIYPQDSDNFQKLREQSTVLATAMKESGNLLAACAKRNDEKVLLYWKDLGWFFFGDLVMSDLVRGKFGEPLTVQPGQVCELVRGFSPEELNAQLRESWSYDVLADALAQAERDRAK